MKLLLIILAIYTSVYGNNSSSYSNNYNGNSNVPVEQTYRGIGYTTNYANGQFNSGVYKSSMTTLEYQNRAFTGTYTPASGSSGGSRSGGGPRRITVYDEDGGSHETPGENDSGDWEYYYYDGTWYRYGYLGWLLGYGWQVWLGNHWSTAGGWIISRITGNIDNATHMYNENPVPIGDAIVPLLSLLLLYMFYDLFIKHMLKK